MYRIIDYNSYWNTILEKRNPVQANTKSKDGDGVIIYADDNGKSGLSIYKNDLTVTRYDEGTKKNEPDYNLTWSQAMNQINRLNSDLKNVADEKINKSEQWRLPTLDELKMMHNRFDDINKILGNFSFSPLTKKDSNDKLTFYWSGDKQSEFFPWSIIFNTGSTFAKNLNKDMCRVRLVRNVGVGWLQNITNKFKG
jgi:hypothetical protein